MKTLILKVSGFILFLFILDRLIWFCLQSQRPSDYKFFLKSKQDFFEEYQEIDILVIGDSHIADAIDPRVIKQQLKMDAFNLGIYHSSPFENYYTVVSALNHLSKKPKYLLLGTNPIMFERPLSKGEYTPIIIPNPISLVYNSEDGFNSSFFFKTLQEKYLFNSLINNIVGKNYEPTRKVESVFNGHLEFYNTLNISNVQSIQLNDGVEDSLQVNYFKKTIELAHQHNIGVIILNPPMMKDKYLSLNETVSFSVHQKTIESIVEKYRIKSYGRYTVDGTINDELRLEEEDFLNIDHLNHSGSVKFTSGFCAYFKSFQEKEI